MMQQSTGFLPYDSSGMLADSDNYGTSAVWVYDSNDGKVVTRGRNNSVSCLTEVNKKQRKYKVLQVNFSILPFPLTSFLIF